MISFFPQRKMVIEDETEFCGEELLHSMLKCKVRLGWAKWEAVGEGMGPLFACLLACGSVVFNFFPGDGNGNICGGVSKAVLFW